MTFPATGTGRVRSLASFLQFAGISGLGWLLDFAILFALVKWFRLPVFVSNLVSATTSAMTVFLISRKLVFRSEETFVLHRTLFYCAYTLIIILAASAALSYLTSVVFALSNQTRLVLSTAACAMIAKLVVTPINFVVNFLVARFTSEYATATV